MISVPGMPGTPRLALSRSTPRIRTLVVMIASFVAAALIMLFVTYQRLRLGVVLGGGLMLVAAATAGAWWLIRRFRAVEEELSESEAAYRSLVDRAAYGIYRSTLGGRFLAVNPALARMLGYDSPEDLMRVHLNDIYQDPDQRRHLIDQYGDRDVIEGVEADWKRRDGKPVAVRLSGRPFHDEHDAVAGFEMIVEDITERRLLEEQLRQSQKMEAVGQLTGGIAHDLNNLLTVVLSNGDLLAARMDGAPPDVRESLDDLREATHRAATMIRKLLAFSRREKLTKRPVHLHKVVGDAVSVLEHVLPESIALSFEQPQTRLPMVEADAGAIEQMLVNLATNARDAMPEGGELRLSLGLGWLSPEFCLMHGWGRPGQYVRLSVADTGTGMTEEVRRHVFEPFFTTKPPGVGTGLGLAMIYGLVKQHDGYIDVESELGGGTTISLYFPATGERYGPPQPLQQPAPTVMPRGTETILVVEDEAIIRRAAVRVLKRLGYRALTAEDGEAGYEVLRREGRRIALVVLDVVMPRLSGPELHQRMRKAGYRIPVLFMSGYAARSSGGIPGLDPTAPFLQKPWTVREFAEKLRETLDAHYSGVRAERG